MTTKKKGCNCFLHEWEDSFGTDSIEFYSEFNCFLPYWVKYTHERKAVLEYVEKHKSDWKRESFSSEENKNWLKYLSDLNKR